ncbi:MAG: flagellar biosynthetic protein FliO [Lachnospiraceae bacterium]|nr:flagellar biosynthetic protein FliO [Lachnospiraceae bacterium]
MAGLLAVNSPRTGNQGSLAQLVTILVIFLLVVLLAWFSAKMLAHYSKASASAHGNMEVVEALRLSPSQVVEIIRIGNRYVAVAVSRDQVSRLGEWGTDELELQNLSSQTASGSGRTLDFLKILKERSGNGNETDQK